MARTDSAAWADTAWTERGSSMYEEERKEPTTEPKKQKKKKKITTGTQRRIQWMGNSWIDQEKQHDETEAEEEEADTLPAWTEEERQGSCSTVWHCDSRGLTCRCVSQRVAVYDEVKQLRAAAPAAWSSSSSSRGMCLPVSMSGCADEWNDRCATDTGERRSSGGIAH